MSQTEAVQYWVDSAREDWEVAVKLKTDGKYHHALFFVQLAIEKLIKAYHIQKVDGSPLYVHNLVLLAQKAGLNFDQTELEHLKEISTFNVTARYDSYKRDFYKKATSEYTQHWFKLAEHLKTKLLTAVATI